SVTDLRTSWIAACRSSFFAPATRTASPWIEALSLSLESLTSFTMLFALSWAIPTRTVSGRFSLSPEILSTLPGSRQRTSTLRLDACGPHHFTEHRIFVAQERIELPGRHRHRLGAELGEALFQVGALQRALRLGVQPREHFARRVRRRQHAHPEIELAAREAG